MNQGSYLIGKLNPQEGFLNLGLTEAQSRFNSSSLGLNMAHWKIALKLPVFHILIFPVQGRDGDAWPLGALNVGTLVHNIERTPGKGGLFCRTAGTSAELIRRKGNVYVLIIIINFHHVCTSLWTKEFPSTAVLSKYFGVLSDIGLTEF